MLILYLLIWVQLSISVNIEHRKFSKKYLAAIFYLEQRVSTGVLYRLNTVLTSAVHLRASISNYVVKTQRYNLSQTCRERFEKASKVKAIHFHPKYYRSNYYIRTNVAVVILERQVNQFTGIKLDTTSLGNQPGIELQLWGWGTQDIAQTQNVSLDSLSNCTQKDPSFPIGTNEICIQTYPLLNLSSGAPLIYLQLSQPILVGIGSWRFPFDPTQRFFRLNNIVPWILNHTTF